jgi:hypothetical protein
MQTYANHGRTDPAFHFFTAPVAVITFLSSIFNLIRRFTLANAWLVVVAAAFLVAVFLIRTYALKVQDRVIRLEETLRMERVLAEPLRSRISGLSVGQFVALRFAPDAELPALVEQTLANGWKQKDIKKAIRTWRPDDFRV